jgi:hypothetical protein
MAPVPDVTACAKVREALVSNNAKARAIVRRMVTPPGWVCSRQRRKNCGSAGMNTTNEKIARILRLCSRKINCNYAMS